MASIGTTSRSHRLPSLALAALVAVAAGCGGKHAKHDSGSDDSSSKKEKQKRPPESALVGVFGESGAGIAEGSNADGALMGAVAAPPHASAEPATFSASWVGVEAALILKRAKAGEFQSTTRSTSDGDCLIFHENGVIRRLMTSGDDESHEFAMSEDGSIILWFRAQRGGDEERQMAFFHRNADLELYQAWEGNGARRTGAAPAGLKDAIFSEARACYKAFGAKNPDPGAGASPVAPPTKTEASHSFKVTATTFKRGETISIAYDAPLAPPPKNQFWITVVPASASDDQFGTWHYVAAGASSDSIVAPGPGDYEIRLHDAFPMFPYRVMSRQRITVVECRASSDCEGGRECNAGSCVAGGHLW